MPGKMLRMSLNDLQRSSVGLMQRSQEYEPIHPPNAIIDNLPPEKQ
jgi:hypothetical protein